jgi:hypothetical protein
MKRYTPIYPVIETKFLGPTNNRGSRVKASRNGIQVTLSWKHELNGIDNHRLAAFALIKKLNWGAGSLESGETDARFVHLFKRRIRK